MPDKTNSVNRQEWYHPDKSKIEEEIKESRKIEERIKEEETSSLPPKPQA